MGKLISLLVQRFYSDIHLGICNLPAIKHQADLTIVHICICEKILIDNSKLVILNLDCNILIVEFRLLHLRGRHTLTAVSNTISTEIIIAGTVIKITAISQYFLTVSVLMIDGLVDVIPDKSTLE